ncbi:RING-6 protein [Curvularia clavata]|uniref:ubiquitinyl hydrolase 1 n=1 Tax=Curvularia clavata TaxID=95742 RepID=A0A9Q8Z5T6_CURCL|nr:RING-6 protein [Curvularia clavata]
MGSGQTYSKHFIPLESSPEIFTELAHSLGLSVSLEFQDVLSLDDAELIGLLPRPAYGLILVFPTTETYEKKVENEDAKLENFQTTTQSDDVVFFRQTINNACGLYAILHAVCNGQARNKIECDSILAKVLSTSLKNDPDELAQALENNGPLEKAYAEAATKGSTDAPINAEDEVDYHYIAFVKSSKSDRLYQLDGDRKRPIELGALPVDEDVLGETCLNVIRKMVALEVDNVNFSLMALVEGAGMLARESWSFTSSDVPNRDCDYIRFPSPALSRQIAVMTKKRKRYPNLAQKLERPWCYYCERDFDDLKILISHQKAKHFKCDRCGRRLNTAGGLSVHMNQVHKENLTQVENAKPGRQGLELEIFGMEGVPAELIDKHNQEVTQTHFAEEQERARLTGNPMRGLYGNATTAPHKRPKINETLEDIEARAAKFREDRKNGVVPPPAEPVQNETPPVVQPPFGVPPGAPAAFPPGAAYPPQGMPQPFAPANPAIPTRPGSIPGQPGALPPRPGFGAPPPGAFPPGQNGDISNSVDDLINEVAKEAAPKEEKKSKKDKNQRLIFYAETESPEEKMAALPRFAEYKRT